MRPFESWIKLNSDGACKGVGALVGCGNLLRNSNEDGSKGIQGISEFVMLIMQKVGAFTSNCKFKWDNPH
ncbi:hypothetical protein A2U01_0007677 [Trifolium medium]|uniref:Uncharacterized protein n=1 Tax=Trifolium medium TaxID=97028 RepID=A0A392MH51_9FABA|nr:hypothetical protein [Trifolium medium]